MGRGKGWRRAGAWILAGGILAAAAWADEIIEMATYIPAPGSGVAAANYAFNGPADSEFVTSSTSYVDVPDSGQSVDLPAGTAVITWSMSWFGADITTPAASVYYIRPVIGDYAPGEGIHVVANRDDDAGPGNSAHLGSSGSWTVVLPAAGSYPIRMQVKRDEGFPGSFKFKRDYVTWTVVVYRS